MPFNDMGAGILRVYQNGIAKKRHNSTMEPITLPLTIHNEERREWLRIDDRLLFEYRLADEPAGSFSPEMPPVTEDMIAMMVSKPTLDLLARGGESIEASPLLPWINKIDWLLETILTSLAKMHPGSVSVPRLCEVNISAGGVGFSTSRQFEPGTMLAMKLILPPFIQIQTDARVIRVVPLTSAMRGFRVATQFTSLNPDDQERLIRHIIQTQAERLRARKDTTLVM